MKTKELRLNKRKRVNIDLIFYPIECQFLLSNYILCGSYLVSFVFNLRHLFLCQSLDYLIKKNVMIHRKRPTINHELPKLTKTEISYFDGPIFPILWLFYILDGLYRYFSYSKCIHIILSIDTKWNVIHNISQTCECYNYYFSTWFT